MIPENKSELENLDPATLFMIAQGVTSFIMLVTSLTSPSFGQLEGLYKKKGLM